MIYDYNTVIIGLLIIIIIYQSRKKIRLSYNSLISYMNYKNISDSFTLNFGNTLTLEKTKIFQSQIDLIIKEHIDLTISYPLLKSMCHYSTCNGKRIRSLIIMIILECFGQKLPSYGINAILFIEYLHASSLIMDDIMDKDLTRRGQLCLYKKYGYNFSQLTAIQLMSMSLIQVSEMMKNINFSMDKLLDKNQILLFIFDNITQNFHNLCLGQYMDINSDQCDINSLINHKTTTLFEISFVLGWILSGGNLNIIESIKKLSYHFGLIFQIADDFEDYEKDYMNDSKKNYLIVNGIDKSYTDFNQQKKKFLQLAEKLNIKRPEISEIVNYLDDKVRYCFVNLK